MKNEEILRWVFLSVLIVSIVSSSIVIPVFSGAQTQIWTEDWQGNQENDFAPDENVYIRGSGFNENVKIDISITRPDNVVENYSTSSDENGCFLYIYTLDGMVGTYCVTATDGDNSASMTFEDSLKHLEGYDKVAGRWERGLLEGWKELDWVPYGIKFATLDNGTSNFNFKVCHNNLLDNKDGVDRLRNFRVGDENGNPVNGSVTVSGPFYKTPGKNCDRDIYYSLSVTFNTPSSGLSWYVYWEAHVAFGASQWPGAKLHAYTENLTGSQDVPIKVPPTPVGSISGSKWNDLSYNGNWDTGEPGLSGWTIQLYFFDPVENIWINLDNEDTGVGGGYKFSKLVAGNYRLTEVLKVDHWVQTYPLSPGSHAITLSEEENRIDVNFGNISVVRGVNISIVPEYQAAAPCNWLEYTVTVTNTGNVDDVYGLSVTDSLGWDNIWLENNTLRAAKCGGENSTKLQVHIPEGSGGNTEDNIIVTAVSTNDNAVSAEDSCIAHVVIVRGVEVSISPENQDGMPGEALAYTITVKNLGNVQENFQLAKGDNTGWTLSLDDNWLLVPNLENRTTMLTVNIPASARGCTWDNIWVKATSKDNAAVFDNKSCLAHVRVVRGVDVSISPEYQSGPPGVTLNYTVAVVNLGDVTDTYDLEVSDNSGWSLVLSENSLSVPAGENRTTTLRVNMPENATGCTRDNVTVTATSRENGNVSDTASCIAHAKIIRGVEVSILPSENGAKPCNWLEYTVTIRNTGNVADYFNLSVSDSLGWDNIWLEDNTLRVDGSDNENTTALHVHIPENAEPGAGDTITVTAISRTDNTVENSDNCVARAAVIRGVDVLVSPPEDDYLLKDVVITNMGNVVDSYNLVAQDNVGWRLMLAENQFGSVAPGENRMTTLRITIPSNTKSGTVGGITVTATSVENAEVGDNAGAQVTASRAVEVWIEPSHQSGAPGETLTYTAWVKNIGNVEDDNYYLSVNDELGWVENENFAGMTLDPNELNWVLFKVPIPKNSVAGTEDVVTVTATSSIEPTVKDNASCIAHVWRAYFDLENLYAVTIDFEGYFPQGENLVAKFYTYGGGSYQDETIVCSENIPGHVTLLENVSRPGNGPIQRVVLVVVDNENNMLRTVKVFETSRTILMGRLSEIDLIWPFASMEKRTQLMAELGDIDLIWPFAPLVFEDP